jgi:UTP:GlnB (protein PII) uridylyltransferase
MLFVSADDQVGLLWAICRWLADHGLSIESAHVDELDGRASDRFVIIGDADVTGLRDHLSGASPSVLDRIRGLLPI